MALPATGSISASEVNVELGNPSTVQLDLNDILVRQLANKLTGAISFDDLRGKELAPISFSPADGATDVELDTSIVVTYPFAITAGTGTIELREGSATGTLLESFEVGVSPELTIADTTLTIQPTAFDYGKEIFVVIPDYAIANYRGTSEYSFTTTVAPVVVSFSPTNNATNQNVNVNWVVTFDSPITKGTGTIQLRKTSATGTVAQNYDVATSNRLTFSGTTLTINPSIELEYKVVYYMVIPANAVKGWAGTSSWKITTKNTTVGQSYCGGKIICQTSNKRWIIAPDNAQVTTNWNNRNQAVSKAQQVTGVSGWFVPSCAQMKNPGFSCRSKWNNANDYYWTNTQGNSQFAWRIDFSTNGLTNCAQKTASFRIRAMKTVSY